MDIQTERKSHADVAKAAQRNVSNCDKKLEELEGKRKILTSGLWADEPENSNENQIKMSFRQKEERKEERKKDYKTSKSSRDTKNSRSSRDHRRDRDRDYNRNRRDRD